MEKFPTDMSALDFWDVCQQYFPKEHDYLVSLVRSFRDKRADYVLIDSRRQKYQMESINFGISLNVIYGDGDMVSDDEQYMAYTFRLTEFGKSIVLDKSAHNIYCLPE